MERTELRALVQATGCAVECAETVFLRDPHWGPGEVCQLEMALQLAGSPCPDGTGWLCIPTGGTSGVLRFARHDERTVNAAVNGFRTHFGVSQINALDVLPAHHVSGLMARIRSLATGGTHVPWTWHQIKAGEWPELPETPDGWFLSLVPTQLQQLLLSDIAVAKLRLFRAVFIGGGPLWRELAEAAAKALIPVAICYGMTETAAMIAAQRPADFAAGERSCGAAMPHVKVEIVDSDAQDVLPRESIGLVRISGPNVFRGYWPNATGSGSLLTEDLGRIDVRGRLQILGRRDAVIITGGEKVSPLEVETALRSSGEFDDIAVIGLPDQKWGRVVVACYPPRGSDLRPGLIEAALENLASFKRPKHWLEISPWPQNAQGKINREALCSAALAAFEARKTVNSPAFGWPR